MELPTSTGHGKAPASCTSAMASLCFVVVTNLRINIKDDGGVKRAEAEFYQLRSSELQWKIERLAVQGEVSFPWWETDRVIPVGDRFFYWVDLHEGIVYEESPKLRFVPLPVDPLRRLRDDGGRAPLIPPETCAPPMAARR